MLKGSVEIHDCVGPKFMADWERLALRNRCRPYLWPGWTSLWWDAFSKGKLQIFAAYQGGHLTGVLPLRSYGGVLSSIEGDEVPLYGFFAESETAARQLLDAVFSQGADRIDLAFLNYPFVGSREALISFVTEPAEGAGYDVLTRSMQKVPYVALDETTWGAYESELRGQLRSSLRRCRRRLEEKGRLSLEIFDGKKWLEELLEEGFRVEGSGWKHAAGTSIYSNPATRVFYTKLAQWAAERGWLRLAFLRLSGVTMAFDYCLEYNRTHYMLKIGYDPAYAKFSPGSVLRQLMIARAFSEGIATYELLGGFEAWKRDWANAYHELQVLHIFTPEEGSQRSWYGQLQMAIQDVAGAVPSREMFVLIDEDSWQIDPGGGRQAIPFVERNGTYWGLPADDETAIQELEKSRQNGANYIVIGWPAFWWLEYYDGLRRHLRSRYRCMLENDRVIVFDLQRSEPTLLRK